MSKKESFRYFIGNKIRIEIPAIQRDYAEGRKTKRIDKISSEMLESMLEVASGRKMSEKLNFVYGYENNSEGTITVIVPLDGQQRLTTLFLLYWFFCENDDLKIDYGKGYKSLFSYAARTTSEDFCNALVLRCAKELYEDYRKTNYEEDFEFSHYLLKRGWFQYTWRNDPTVSSMLNVLSKIARMATDMGLNTNEWHNYYESLDNIQFDFEDLQELNAGEELYVKMNARGKPLSSFDLLKSDLEEELQAKIVSARNNGDTEELEEIEKQWRKKFNTSWMQYFWKIASNDSERPIEAERLFENLLQNLVFFDGCELDQNVESIKTEKDGPFDSYKRIRKEGEWNSGLSFSNYIDSIDSLIISGETSDEQRMDGGDLVRPIGGTENEEVRLINRLLGGDSVGYFDLVYLYALIRFLRIKGLSSTEILEDAEKKDNLNTWMTFVHNVWSSDNSGTSEIDKPNKLKAVIRFIDTLLGDYSDGDNVNDLIINIDEGGSIALPLLDISLDEEKIKANLRKNDDRGSWHELFDKSLKDEFLNGQIISILEWSKDNHSEYDATKASGYFEKLQQLTRRKDCFYKLMLLHGDYREFSKLEKDSYGSLLPFNGRERSVKNYLRDKRDGKIAIHLKELIDEWEEGKTLEEFAEDYQNKHINNINDWRLFFIEYQDWYEFLKPSGKKWRYKVKTDNGIHFINVKETEEQDAVYEYIYSKVKSIYDSEKKGVSVKRDKNTIMILDKDAEIEALGNGEYIFTHGGTEKKCNDYQELMTLLNEIINIKP